MLLLPTFKAAAVAASFSLCYVPATWAVNKCTGPDGKTAYQAEPCPIAGKSEPLKLQAAPPASSQDVEFNAAIARGRIMVGMTASQVRRAWGSPHKINRSIGSYGTHEQWVYGDSIGRSNYVYVQNGVVSSMQGAE